MESRFSNLLSTNYIPSKHEIDEIHNLLTDPINQLTQLDTEIARLQNIIDQLSLKRTQLHIDVVNHKALTTPMRRIPQELLQEIFIHCLPTHHNAIMSSREAPLLLGLVCSQWRSVSRSTPRLWSSIHVAVSGDPPWNDRGPVKIDEKNQHMEAIQAWLSLSGGLPLSISFFHAHSSSEYAELYTETLISTLLQFSHRWINVCFFTSRFSPALSSISIEAVPLLETFSFHVSSHSKIGASDIFRAPQLRKISSSHWRMIPEDMDWSHVTSLSLEARGYVHERLTPVGALGILRNCPNLVHCRLEFPWNTSYFITGDVVTLPLLETLTVKKGPSFLNLFFEQLRLPALIKLEFSSAPLIRDGDIVVPEDPSIYALLPRLDCLRELTLSAFGMQPQALVKCLQYVPYITRLSILVPSPLYWHVTWPSPNAPLHTFNDEVVSLLTPLTPTNDEPLLLCPRLKVLECNPGGVSDKVLLAFIQQRTSRALIQNVQRLERVEINFRRQKEVDILSILPPEVLAETQITLGYSTPVVHRTNSFPHAGLEEPGRLELVPNRTYELRST